MDFSLSLKLRRLAFFSTLTVVWVHGFNLDERYLWPGYNLEGQFSLNSYVQLLVCNGFFRFAIPLFFAISGYMMAEREGRLSYPNMVLKRAKMLLSPYLAWSAIGLLITYLWEEQATLSPFVDSANLRPFGDKNLHLLSWTEWLQAWFITPISFQLWFLRSLFIYSVIYPVLVWVIEKKPVIYFVVAIILCLLSIDLFIVGGDGLLYFGMGIFLRKKQIDPNKLPQIFYSPYFQLVAFSIPFLLAVSAFTDPSWATTFGYFLYKFMQPFLLVAVWTFYDRLIKRRTVHFFDVLSTTNFFIYGAHVPLVYFLTDWLFSEFGKAGHVRLAIFICLPVVIILVSGGLGLLLKRFLPFVFGVLSGWRKFKLQPQTNP